MTALLQTKSLSRDFGGLKAVDAVDFTLEKGEIRAVIGPNGAGKSTLAGLIAGRIAPSSGTIAFGGRDITSTPAHKRDPSLRTRQPSSSYLPSDAARLSSSAGHSLPAISGG